MRWRIQKLPLLPLCVAGFFVGIFIGFLKGQDSALLSPENLLREQECLTAQMQKDQWEISALALGKERIKWMIFLILSATTYLAPMVCRMGAAWLGLCLGSFTAMALRGYGIKGIFLVAGGLFPHWIPYGIGFFELLLWCEALYEGIYRKRSLARMGMLARLALILLMILTGIFLESHVHPKIMAGILQNL